MVKKLRLESARVKPVFAAWNMAFDWEFIRRALKVGGFEPDQLFNFHRIDLFGIMAVTIGSDSETNIGHDGVRAWLNHKRESTPHRALVGAYGHGHDPDQVYSVEVE